MDTRRNIKFKTEEEIFSQYEALEKTYAYIMGKAEEIKEFKEKHACRGLTYVGCGSSYSLCKSARVSAQMRMDAIVNSIAAGDLLINFPHYRKLIKDTMIIALSRSGSTSELVYSVKKAREDLGAECLLICAKENSGLSQIAGLSLEIPCAFDQSVCQTRTVSNLYLANLMLIGLMQEDRLLLEELKSCIDSGENYMKEYRDILKAIANRDDWDKAVVLADSELEGIAEEGALAFNEICRCASNYYHVLDVRHGPMVMVNSRTLVILACSPEETNYQKDLVKDLKARGALVVTVSSHKDNIWGSDYNITVPGYKNYGVAGIPFIYVPQAVTLFRALARNINPDEPQGLDPWIKL